MNYLFKNWGLLLFKGLVFIALAIYTFFHPVETLVALALYIGISLIITGIILIYAAFKTKNENPEWTSSLAEGAIDLLFGIVLITNPGLTVTVIPFIVGFWLMVLGVILAANGFKARKEEDSNWSTILIGGIVLVILGYLMISKLFFGAFAITVWFGIGFLIVGLINVFIALGLRKVKSHVKEGIKNRLED